MYAEFLDYAGMRAETAENGRVAVRRALRSHPAAIVMDLAMPVMDGAQFLDKKRRASHLAPIPVLLISADAQIARKAKELDVEGYLKKPVHLDALLSAVARHCAPRQA